MGPDNYRLQIHQDETTLVPDPFHEGQVRMPLSTCQITCGGYQLDSCYAGNMGMGVGDVIIRDLSTPSTGWGFTRLPSGQFAGPTVGPTNDTPFYKCEALRQATLGGFGDDGSTGGFGGVPPQQPQM
jgi:hypothetical protein